VTGSDNPLTPKEEEVRRLLAEARHTGSTPPDVVARLDRVLDDLAQEPDHTAPVVDLARRRRRVAGLLVAAAAVAVIGVGVGQVVDSQEGADTTAARGAAESADERTTSSVQPKSGPGDGEHAGESAPASQDAQGKSVLVELRRNYLAEDLTKLRRLSAVDAQPLNGTYQARRRSADRAAGAACGVDSWGRGRFVPVSYGGTPAVLVLRRPVGDTQVADLFLCGSDAPIRSVTLPAP
jgi:hypothetical protein